MSKRWGTRRAAANSLGEASAALARSEMVSVAAKKFGGEDTQPIGFAKGMPISFGSFGRVGNNTASR